MAQGWLIVAWIVPGILLLLGFVFYVRRRDAQLLSKIQELQDGHEELAEMVSGRDTAPQPEIPAAPKARGASAGTTGSIPGMSRADAELLMKVRAAQAADDESGDHAG